MKALSAYQVASLRMMSAGIVLLPIGIRKLKQVPRQKLGLILWSGLLGSFFPSFLFCLAEVRISSSVAGFLNALTPIITIVTGVLFFHNKFAKNRLPGVLIAFTGMVILFFGQGYQSPENILFSSFVLLATICYAINVNMVTKYLKDVNSTNIAAIACTLLIIPSLFILWSTGFFSLRLNEIPFLLSTIAAAVLGIGGTAIASILFYILLKRAGILFSSMVTYGIPFVALFWGILAGENIHAFQIIGLGVILGGIYVTNR